MSEPPSDPTVPSDAGPGEPDAVAGAVEPGETTEPAASDEETRIADAAASALARARAAAAAKGLRPGMRPLKRRRPIGQAPVLSGSARDGRDPALLGDQLDRLLLDRGWKVDVAVGSVMGRWGEIVGPDIASHVQPLTFAEGILTVRADSTAWATQMRLLTSSVLARVDEEIGAGAVTELKVLGPSAPSWNRGPRRSPDSRGPRDTYG
ncbi:RNA-binding protein [Intrasporangium oryzae NRRL B-24470]|uniref:RNA-binding protein n=1 Tax=Intrasporangium oryzae NRRL B-24470 TaxID=1386089 RepID=W9G4X1_9MICO|nr:DciA family protein [Intrasporangium oryzae]EWT01040.1 RNA-binding protein [Intrasporangium oryzae NRRL B-24470]